MGVIACSVHPCSLGPDVTLHHIRRFTLVIAFGLGMATTHYADPTRSVLALSVAVLILVLLVSSYLTRHAPAAEAAMPADAAGMADPSGESV